MLTTAFGNVNLAQRPSTRRIDHYMRNRFHLRRQLGDYRRRRQMLSMLRVRRRCDRPPAPVEAMLAFGCPSLGPLRDAFDELFPEEVKRDRPWEGRHVGGRPQRRVVRDVLSCWTVLSPFPASRWISCARQAGPAAAPGEKGRTQALWPSLVGCWPSPRILEGHSRRRIYPGRVRA